jgi:hypothetical protein
MSGSGAGALGAGRVTLELVGVAGTAATVLADLDAVPPAGLAPWADAGRRFERAFEFAIADVSVGSRGYRVKPA